jgi:DUF4097 and DUF4098 domain-containing protein YvlB
MSAQAGTPVTWGWIRPVVLFPSDAIGWPTDRRRAALQHELAHVARFDYLTQLLAQLTCALFWFHPLAWIAARRMRSESEHACDDRVLSTGTAAAEYARHLLEVARDARSLRLASLVAVGMARPSHLEGRLLAVLDERRGRRGVSLRAGSTAAVTVAMALVPLAAVRFELRAAAPQSIAAATTPIVNERTADLAAQPIVAATPASREEASDSVVTRELPATPGELLELDLETGASVHVRGWDENKVSVRVMLGGRDWRETGVDIEEARGGVRIGTRQTGRSRSYMTSHALDLRVPKKYDLRLRSAGGSVTLVDLDGNFDGNTGGGELRLDHVRGRVHLSTGGGDVSVVDVDASGAVSTGGGMVKMSRVRGGLRGSSGSGPVLYAEMPSGMDRDTDVKGDISAFSVEKSGRIRYVGGKSGIINIEKAGGSVELEEAPEGAKIRTGGGRIFVGRGAGTIEANTGGGDIDIGPIAGSVLTGTGAGNVRVRLVDAAGKEQSVEVTTGNGKVIVQLPSNFEGRFDLETAYTANHGRTRIESPWALTREETTEYDGSHGTPRKYVRGRGRVGNKDGVVYVRATNGDIEIRRAP